MASPQPKVILFDFSTVVEDFYADTEATKAISSSYPALSSISHFKIAHIWPLVIQATSRAYMAGEISRDDIPGEQVKQIHWYFDLKPPSKAQTKHFFEIYGAAFDNSSPAVSGSIDTLVRLKENGFRIAALSKWTAWESEGIAARIGIRGLVEVIITTGHLGRSAKLDTSTWEHVARCLGAEKENIIFVTAKKTQIRQHNSRRDQLYFGWALQETGHSTNTCGRGNGAYDTRCQTHTGRY